VGRQCLERLGLTVTQAAESPAVTRRASSDVVNERAGISVEMAIRLSKAFGSSPETWLGLQMAYDLWQARERMASRSVNSIQVSAAPKGGRPKGGRYECDPRGQSRRSVGDRR
jgi:antitoxin HigA-1